MIQPLRNYVVVKKVVGRTTSGGIVLPDTVDEHYAEVVVLGPDVKNRDLVGKRILVSRDCDAQGVTWEGQEFGVVKEDGIVAILPPDEGKSRLVRPDAVKH